MFTAIPSLAIRSELGQQVKAVSRPMSPIANPESQAWIPTNRHLDLSMNVCSPLFGSYQHKRGEEAQNNGSELLPLVMDKGGM